MRPNTSEWQPRRTFDGRFLCLGVTQLLLQADAIDFENAFDFQLE